MLISGMLQGLCAKSDLVEIHPEIWTIILLVQRSKRLLSVHFFPSGLLIKSVNWLQIGNMTEPENV